VRLDGEATGDRFGEAVLLAADLTGDTLVDALIGAPDHDTPGGPAGEGAV